MVYYVDAIKNITLGLVNVNVIGNFNQIIYLGSFIGYNLGEIKGLNWLTDSKLDTKSWTLTVQIERRPSVLTVFFCLN